VRLASLRHFDNTILCALLLAFASAYLGFVGDGNTRFPDMATYGLLTLAASAVLYALFLYQHRSLQVPSKSLDEHQTRLALAASLVLNFSIAWKTQLEYRPWLLICNAALLGLLLRKKPAPNLAFALVLLAGIGMRCITKYRVAFGGTDMLPLVRSGLNFFLAGESPYRQHVMQMAFGSYLLDMTYLPLTWLSYLPAYLLNIDLRWTNIAADTVSALLLWVAVGCTRNRSYLPALVIGIWFLNPYFAYRVDSEIAIFCVVLSLFLYAISSDRFGLLAVASGLMLATTQLSLIILPFALFHIVAVNGLQKSVPYVAIAIFVAGALITPFYGNAMLKGVLGHWLNLYGASFDWARTTLVNFNFAVFFYYLQKQYLLPLIQMLICIVMLVLFLGSRNAKSPAATLNFAALTLLLFLQFNILVWTYIFTPAFILWSWSIALSGNRHQKIIPDIA
jgi:hypothetical protein